MSESRAFSGGHTHPLLQTSPQPGLMNMGLVSHFHALVPQTLLPEAPSTVLSR